MFSTGAHSLVIGTDPKEWWTGSDVPDVWIVQTRGVGGLLTLKPSGISAYCIGNVGWVADESLFTLGSGVALRVRPRDRTRALAQFAKSAFPPRDRRLGSRAEIRSRSSTPPTAVLASCAAYRSFNTGSSLIYSAVTAQECAVKQLVELARRLAKGRACAELQGQRGGGIPVPARGA